MSDLVTFAIAAHGGVERWKSLTSISATFTLKGAVWKVKGREGEVVNTTARALCHRQHITYTPFLKNDQRSVLEPGRVAIETVDGHVLQSRESGLAAFSDHTRATRWDDLHLAYFTGYAMWNYLTAPFMFTLPGFKTEEIEPWNEQGEEWRRLKVTFPKTIVTHCPEQVFYFDQQGLLRRLDYAAQVLGSLPAANYASDHRELAGIVIPHRRRVYLRNADNTADLSKPVAVSIDFTSAKVT